MRFDTPVYFQKVTTGAYNASTGDYEPDTIVETQQWASVTNAGENTINIIYGSVKEGSLVIRLQQPYTLAYDFIRIGGKVYRADLTRKLRTKHVIIVSEVQ